MIVIDRCSNQVCVPLPYVIIIFSNRDYFEFKYTFMPYQKKKIFIFIYPSIHVTGNYSENYFYVICDRDNQFYPAWLSFSPAVIILKNNRTSWSIFHFRGHMKFMNKWYCSRESFPQTVVILTVTFIIILLYLFKYYVLRNSHYSIFINLLFINHHSTE